MSFKQTIVRLIEAMAPVTYGDGILVAQRIAAFGTFLAQRMGTGRSRGNFRESDPGLSRIAVRPMNPR